MTDAEVRIGPSQPNNFSITNFRKLRNHPTGAAIAKDGADGAWRRFRLRHRVRRSSEATGERQDDV